MDTHLYQQLLDEIDAGRPCAVLTALSFEGPRQGKITEKALYTQNRGTMPQQQALDDCLSTGRMQLLRLSDDKALLIEPFLPRPRLVIFGGGHVAKPLSEFAFRAGFAVAVMDDRPFFANADRFPQAETLVCDSFDKALERIAPRPTDFIAIITRGHRHDGEVLRQMLTRPVAYLGMIGSRRRIQGMWHTLSDEGFDPRALEAVHAPIGLDICAVTPDEIAFSIVAQLIAVKNAGLRDRQGKNPGSPEFDRDVIRTLMQPPTMPRAACTILESKGSVPRRAGAKMTTYYDGRTVGSIGGGCSEGAVIAKARDIMDAPGRFCIESVDMTGDVAESEGMVCGGTMEVLVEIL